MKKISLLLIITIISFQAIHAQKITKFSDAPELFIEELESFMKATKLETNEVTVDEFIELYSREQAIDSGQMSKIIETCNIMLDRRMQANPYFRNYLITLMNFFTYQDNPSRFVIWENILNQVLLTSKKGSPRNFKKFNSFSNGLFTNKAIYSSKSKTWVISTDNYE